MIRCALRDFPSFIQSLHNFVDVCKLTRIFLVIQALTALKEAQEWCSNGGSVPASMAADCAPAYDLQPDVPYPERKDIKDPHTRP